jgi:hypothetical protein
MPSLAFCCCFVPKSSLFVFLIVGEKVKEHRFIYATALASKRTFAAPSTKVRKGPEAAVYISQNDG